MSAATLDIILAQAKRLTPDEQARLISALLRTAKTEQIEWSAALSDAEDLADVEEQRATWAYLQRALDVDAPADAPAFLSRRLGQGQKLAAQTTARPDAVRMDRTAGSAVDRSAQNAGR